MHYRKIGPFITQVIKNGVPLYTSRALRKSSTLPKRAVSSWISLLFMVGAFCFAFASFSSLTYLVVPYTIASIYFIGSIFFTSAAYLQYLESINSDITHLPHLYNKHHIWFWWRWRPRNLGYISSVTQFIGTLFFNISTFFAIFSTLSIEAKNLFIWMPNLLGSILFLTSSLSAYLEIVHDTDIKAFKTVTWWIVWINIFGSVFFQISALYSSFSVQEVDGAADHIATLMTCLGGICFFIAAFLLRYERS
jgi:hypothetical protein